MAVTRADLAQHASRGDAWVAVGGVVYDVTEFAHEHPGGAGLLHALAGKDATEDFDAMHPRTYLEQYLGDKVVGRLVEGVAAAPAPKEIAAPAPPPPAADPPAAPSQPEVAVPRPPPPAPPAAPTAVKLPSGRDGGRLLLMVSPAAPAARVPFCARAKRPLPPAAPRAGGAYATPPCSFSLRLRGRSQLTHNTYSLAFDLPTAGPGAGLRLYPGQHVYLKNATGAVRPYTPVLVSATSIVFVVKVYPGGALGEYLKALAAGEGVEAEVKAFDKCRYIERGWYTTRDAGESPQWAKNISLLCGGTGITPVYSVMKAVLENPLDLTHVHLLYANQSPDDVLLCTQLRELQEAYPSRVRIWYTVDRAAPGWAYSTGYIDAAMLRFLPHGPEDITLVCGPPPMVRSLKALLPQVGNRSPVVYL